MEHFLAAENYPFSIAISIMCFITVMEAIGLVLGMSPSELVDSYLPDFDVPDIEIEAPSVDVADSISNIDMPHSVDVGSVETGGLFTKILGWLSFGRVPALIWLVIFLSAFGLAGLIVQAISKTLSGWYLPAVIAIVPALAVSLPTTRHLGRGMAKILPKDESEAVSRDAFIGRVANILRGEASVQAPAEAKLKDRFGQTHYILVVPDIATEIFPAGSEVLIVAKQGPHYRAIDVPSDKLSAQ